MPKGKDLAKVSQSKIQKFCKQNLIDEKIANKLRYVIHQDVLRIKDCSEKSIVDFYIEQFGLVKDSFIGSDTDWAKLKSNARKRLVEKYVGDKMFDDNIDIYFNEVKREYIMHPQGESDDLDFCPENRDVFVKNNLKLAVEVAKRYRGLGIPFDDLIQVANLGLLLAFDKFDTEKNSLRASIISDIKSSEQDSFTFEEAKDLITRNFKYTKLLDVTLAKIPQDGFEDKEVFLDWARVNIKGASFSSISFFWIRAIIMAEVNNYSKIVRVPKSAMPTGEDDDDNSAGKISIIRLDSPNPYTDDCYTDNQLSSVYQEEFAVEDSAIDEIERQATFKDLVAKLICHLSPLDRRVISKKFGIGLPFPMSINEIAENEQISVNKVKTSINQSMKAIQEMMTEEDIQTVHEMLK